MHVGPKHLWPLWYHGGTALTRIVACTALGIHTTAHGPAEATRVRTCQLLGEITMWDRNSGRTSYAPTAR
eukprot:4057402-Lingulodinium_polyedra.AAC.1